MMTQQFVYRTVLAFSATHLAALENLPGSNSRPRMLAPTHLITGLHHRALALESFHPALVGDLTSSTCEAALVAAELLGACSFALSLANPPTDTQDHMDQVIQVGRLFQGAVALFRLGRKDLNDGAHRASWYMRQSVVVTLMNELPWLDAEGLVMRIVYSTNKLRDQEASKRAALEDVSVKLLKSP